jgi:hypothetical protein
MLVACCPSLAVRVDRVFWAKQVSARDDTRSRSTHCEVDTEGFFAYDLASSTRSLRVAAQVGLFARLASGRHIELDPDTFDVDMRFGIDFDVGGLFGRSCWCDGRRS